MTTYDLGQVVGAKGDTGNGISSVALQSTSGKTKTYRITFTNGSHFDYQVVDGADGSNASVTIQTSWGSTTSDAKVPSEKLVKTGLDGKSDSSHTHGNLQSNGQVGSTAQASKNVVTDSSGKITTEDKPSIPTASSTTPSADTTSGSVGTGTTWARSNHTHPKSSIYAEASHTHSAYVNPTIADNLTTNSSTQVLSAKQGKILNDMIGSAIQYIQQ